MKDIAALFSFMDSQQTGPESQQAVTVPEKVEITDKPVDISIPDWAKSATKFNLRAQLSWDNNQYTGVVVINGALVEAVMDSGGARTMIDMRTAQEAQIPWTEAKGSEFGQYITPGGAARPYLGIAPGPIRIQFNEKVVITLSSIKIIDHSEPLILIGADVLKGGKGP